MSTSEYVRMALRRRVDPVSPDIVAVLVVPAEDDPGGLLRYGALGARPPVAHRFRHRDVGVWEHSVVDGLVLARPELWRSQELALPLWWDGALVPEGWDRLRRVSLGVSARDWTRAGISLTERLGGEASPRPHWAVMVRLAEGLVPIGIASRIVRLARVDGRLVEVQPPEADP